MNPRRRTRLQIIGTSAFLIVIALGPLFWGNRWEGIHTVDFLQFLAAGTILGVLLTNLVLHVRGQAAN